MIKINTYPPLFAGPGAMAHWGRFFVAWETPLESPMQQKARPAGCTHYLLSPGPVIMMIASVSAVITLPVAVIMSVLVAVAAVMAAEGAVTPGPVPEKFFESIRHKVSSFFISCTLGIQKSSHKIRHREILRIHFNICRRGTRCVKGGKQG